jgi:protein-L-isoaspartate(D-aspartate) O-methyltransferase
VLHLGCGAGYYTAVLAEVAGASGRVVAVEADAALAEEARRNLAPWPQVQVVCGDGTDPQGPHDAVLVNAGATHARPEWLAALREGGRLLLPLTAHVPMFPHGVGFVLRLERRGTAWPARVVSPVGIFDCLGARDPAAEAQLRRLLAPGAAARVRVAETAAHERTAACLVHREGFCLQE